MKTVIKEYSETYKEILVDLMVRLQMHEIKVDPFKILVMNKGYGEIYTNDLLYKIDKLCGKIFLAEVNNKVVGCIAGIIEISDDVSKVEYKEIKIGRILELIVYGEYRGRNIGKDLIKKMEHYLKNNKCDYINMQVLKSNIGACNLYKKLGYIDRNIDMMKKI